MEKQWGRSCEWHTNEQFHSQTASTTDIAVATSPNMQHAAFIFQNVWHRGGVSSLIGLIMPVDRYSNAVLVRFFIMSYVLDTADISPFLN